jgi:putative FmdB family regulatory protein
VGRVLAIETRAAVGGRRSRVGEAASLRLAAQAWDGKGEAMPVYEYRCQGCGKRFEITAHLAERDKLAICPKCHSKKVEVVISSFTCAPPRKY